MESSRHTLDQWQQTIDERIRAILPGVVLFRELQAEVKALSQRLSELEAELQKRASPPGGRQEPPQDKE
jgi:polyhydroxyalkanoate synthesis regulator phasin